MDEEYANEEIEIAQEDYRCPTCDLRMPNNVCPQCGITKEKIEQKDEDELYDRRERR